MIISLNWIKEFVDLNGIPVDELVKRFGLSTAEIEKVTYVGQDLENIVVAQILEVNSHPNSDHLHILKVDDGSGSAVQVVCSAPNVKAGLKTFFARVGANVRGTKIKPARLAGVESFGMCCGGWELGIEEDTSGIVELDSSTPIGKDIKEMLPVEDVLIEIDNKSLTNRPDLWGHYGIAREFAAIFNRELKPLKTDLLENYKNLPALKIKVETKKCFRYSGISVKNITKKVSSPIIKLRLKYCGMRDINLLTDLANYIMLELGQPMHTFDNSIVKGITVIEADKNVKMETLEHETHTIEPGSIVICDENRTPVAIAGIKGGLKSGITEKTNSVLIESACFDSATIRKTSRKIGLITDASLRYEKSLDPELCKTATARMLYLLKEIDAGADVNSSFTDVYNFKYPTHKITITEDFIARRGGVKLSLDEIVNILIRLGFQVGVDKDKIDVIVPSFRGTKDVSIKEDLVEEIFRMYGYDNIKSSSMSMPLQPVEQLPIHKIEYSIKYALASIFNLNEVHSYVWNYADFNKKMGIEEVSVVNLLDSSKSGHSGLRCTLAPTLLRTVYENKNKFDDIEIFEIGRTFDELDSNNLVKEKRKLAIVIASQTNDDTTNYFKLKQIVEYITKNIVNIKVDYSTNSTSKIYHPINSCTITSGEHILGEMGILHPSIAANIDKRKHFAVLELNLASLLEAEKTPFKLAPVSKYQSVSIDFNFVADKTMPYAKIENALNNFKASHILEHSLKDIYQNEETLKDKISYTINFVVTPKNKTLEAKDLETFSARLIKEMKSIGLTLRE